LKRYNNIESQPIYHPPEGAEDLYCAKAGDYFFYPSRLAAIKRQHLVIEALGKTRSKEIRVKFAGLPDNGSYEDDLRKMASRLHLEKRVEWLGKVTHSQKCDLYARALGVIFLPVDEDYGYITLESMAAAKPVLTAKDSGGPLEFVGHGAGGIIMDPTPEAVAEAMDQLWEDRDRAAKIGREGRQRYDSLNLSWANVVKKLLA
jgi:glycosyltransferase involved in cell wall biosynthesis